MLVEVTQACNFVVSLAKTESWQAARTIRADMKFLSARNPPQAEVSNNIIPRNFTSKFGNKFAFVLQEKWKSIFIFHLVGLRGINSTINGSDFGHPRNEHYCKLRTKRMKRPLSGARLLSSLYAGLVGLWLSREVCRDTNSTQNSNGRVVAIHMCKS